MGKKILVLNGSPRKGGNTELLVDAFIEGAQQAGHTVDKCNVGRMDIHPCIGCLGGGKNPDSPCTQKDEMDTVYPLYKAADILVLASPMYYWGITAQLKAAIDRLFAVVEQTGGVSPMGCLMLMAAEGDSDSNNAPVKAYYESLLGHLGWQDLGQLYAGGVYRIGDIKGKPALEQARALGAGLV